jgi:hypothetical protein
MERHIWDKRTVRAANPGTRLRGRSIKRRESSKFREARGKQCAYPDVISTVMTEMNRWIREGVTAGEVIYRIVAIGDAYEPTRSTARQM